MSDESQKPEPAANVRSFVKSRAFSSWQTVLAIWTEIFYGILFEPQKTLSLLIDPQFCPPNRLNLFIAAGMVVLSSCFEGYSKIILGLTSDHSFGQVVSVILGNIFNWLAIAAFLRLLLWSLNQECPYKSILITTGWCFLPLIFLAPASLLMQGGVLFCFVPLFPKIWFFILQFLAFNIALKQSKVKTLALILVIPPLLVLVYIFWCLITGLLIAAQWLPTT